MEPVAERCSVRITENFAADLADIERYWQLASEDGASNRCDRLLDDLETVVANLERFPDAGRSFDAWRPNAVESLVRLERLEQRLQALCPEGGPPVQMRQYVMEDCLLLYARIGDTLHLLTIRHHLQLSFDISRFWLNP